LVKYQIFLIARQTVAYEIKTLGSISITKNTPISPMPLPEEDSDENILMKIEGNSTTMNVSWTMIDSPTCIGGLPNHTGTEWQVTSPDPRSTSIEQLEWLENEFAPNSLNDYYEIVILNPNITSADYKDALVYGKLGIFQSFNFTADSSSPVIWNASFDFIEGNVVTSLGGNTHEVCTIQNASYGAGNPPTTIIVNCKEFQNYVSGDRPDTTAIVLRYRKLGAGFWKETEVGVTANTTPPYNYSTTFNVGLESGEKYECKIAIVNSGGRGEWSEISNLGTA